MIPYFETYGSAASAEVRQMLARLLLDIVNLEGHLSDFIGYLDEDAFVIITSSAHAQAITERLTEMFAIKIERFYPDPDWRSHEAHLNDFDLPRMQLSCRITTGELSLGLMH